MVESRKLVAPVADKVQYTHQAKVDTHPQSHSKSDHSKYYKKAESDPRIESYDHHNQS